MEAGRNLSPRLVLPSSPPLPSPARKHAPSSSVEYSPPHRPALSSKPPRLPNKSLLVEAAPPLFPTNEIASLPLAPLPHHLAPFLLPDCPLTREEKYELFTRVYLRSASSGNSDTLEWLLSIPTTPSASASTTNHRFSAAFGVAGLSLRDQELDDGIPRKWVNLEARDEEGNSALGLAVALGHAEVVRALVEGGIDINGGDRGKHRFGYTCQASTENFGLDSWLDRTPLGSTEQRHPYRLLSFESSSNGQYTVSQRPTTARSYQAG